MIIIERDDYVRQICINFFNDKSKGFLQKRNSEKIEVHFRIRKRMNCTEIWGEGKKKGLFFGYPNNNIKKVLKF